jgi:hypothetical protein
MYPHESCDAQFNQGKIVQCIVTRVLVCIRSYLKSVLRHKMLIMDTYRLDTLYVRQQVCEDPWLLFETKRGPQAKRIWETLS